MKNIIAAVLCALMLAVSPASAGGTRPAYTAQALNNTASVGTIATSTIPEMVLAKNTAIVGTNTTGDIMLFRNAGGATIGSNGLTGILCINAQDTATGANAFSVCYAINTTGLGTTSATLNAIGSGTVRGTSPFASIQIAADGGSGAAKVTATTAATGISGANVIATFIGAVRP